MPISNTKHPQGSAPVDVAANLRAVQDSIIREARKAGRSGEDVTLVAVSKTHDADRIEPALVAGHLHFGENRVQEAQAKWPGLRARFPNLVLHLIGPLQTNKVRDALALFDVIETVDRPKLARALAKEMAKEMTRSERRRSFLIQVNTGEEAQKAGVLPAQADDFIALCRDELGLPIAGLMCIPPLDDEPAPHFAFLREIARRNGLAALSMGMSHDFGAAVALGATQVRVGTAIFGPRGGPRGG